MEKLDKKITLCLSADMYEKVKYFAKQHYFSGVQDYIRMSILLNVEVYEEKEQKQE